MTEEVKTRKSKYPWESWTSTQAWRVQWGLDFECLPESFRSQIHIEGHHRGLKVVTTIITGRLPGEKHEGIYVFFQFYERYSPWKPNLEALPAVRALRG